MTTTSRSGRKPRDEIIEREIRRRLVAGERITYRDIRSAVGGAPATIKRVLERMGLATDAAGRAEREIQVRERLKEAGAMRAQAESYLKGAREAGDAIAKEISATLASVRDAHTILMRDVESVRQLAIQLGRELAANRPAQASDPLMEARLKRASAENGRMAQRIEHLVRRLHEAGIEDV